MKLNLFLKHKLDTIQIMLENGTSGYQLLLLAQGETGKRLITITALCLTTSVV